MTIILDGKTLAEKILKEIKIEIAENKYTPSLAVVIVGTNPASQIYVKNKNTKAKELGMNSIVVELPENIPQIDLENKIDNLANDKNIDAILVQLPLPNHIDTQKIIEKIPPQKDVDGFHPYNIGRLFSGEKPFAQACTPKGIIDSIVVS